MEEQGIFYFIFFRYKVEIRSRFQQWEGTRSAVMGRVVEVTASKGDCSDSPQGQWGHKAQPHEVLLSPRVGLGYQAGPSGLWFKVALSEHRITHWSGVCGRTLYSEYLLTKPSHGFLKDSSEK